MHNSIQSLYTSIEEVYREKYRMDTKKFIPNENELRFVAGFAFSPAAGRTDAMGTSPTAQGEASDHLLIAAAEVMREFPEAGKGRVVAEQSLKEIGDEDVEGLEFEPDDVWTMDKLMREMNKVSRARGSGRGGGGEECPMQ